MNKILIPYNNKVSNESATLSLIKKGIWLYFFLLLFEGALRKWFLPFLSGPLLIVRDPIAIWLIYKSWKHSMMPNNIYILVMTVFGILAISTALVFGHGSITVAIYGARILIIHFPIMFIIGKFFDHDDVVKLGKILLFIAIPMAILVGLQFYSPQSAWVNRGIGGNVAGAGFSGAMGYFRPPGTFSFTTGNVMFFSFVACFLFYFWLSKVKINRLILIGATVALLVSVPLSISRTLLFSIGVTFIFTLISVASKPKFFIRILLFLIIGSLALGVLSQTSFFETSTAAFTDRFESASKVEGGVANSLVDRFFGGMLTAINDSNELPFFGYGLGMGTNAGAAILTGSSKNFLIAEGEWLRLVGEMGFVMGIIVLLIRVIFCTQLFMKSYQSLRKGIVLPWLLLSFGFLIILQGQWAQPTVLGFSTLLGGLILASCNTQGMEVENKINNIN